MAKNREKILTLPCKVSEGIFSFEKVVSVVMPTEQTYFGFVQDCNLILDQKPRGDEEVDGRIKISLIKFDNKNILFSFPEEQSTFRGTRFKVPAGWFREHVSSVKVPMST